MKFKKRYLLLIIMIMSILSANLNVLAKDTNLNEEKNIQEDENEETSENNDAKDEDDNSENKKEDESESENNEEENTDKLDEDTNEEQLDESEQKVDKDDTDESETETSEENIDENDTEKESIEGNLKKEENQSDQLLSEQNACLNDEEIIKILQEDCMEGACGNGINYSFDEESKTLTLSGEGDLFGEYETVTDLPWFIFYEEIENYNISGEIRIKLWQISKKSAALSNRCVDLDKKIKELIEQKRQELESETIDDIKEDEEIGEENNEGIVKEDN